MNPDKWTCQKPKLPPELEQQSKEFAAMVWTLTEKLAREYTRETIQRRLEGSESPDLGKWLRERIKGMKGDG